MKKIIKKVLGKFKRILKERELRNKQKSMLDFLSFADFCKITNEKPKQINKICFVVPEINPYSGGHTSIFRLATKLAEKGIDVTCLITGNQEDKEIKACAEILFKGYKGSVYSYNTFDKTTTFDCVIATNVESVYYAKVLKGYKIIFVQDYEPYFFEAGDSNLYAKKEYEMGYHLICLGPWNKRMIQQYTDSDSVIDFVEFPYEPSEYKDCNKDYLKYKEKKELKLCVYIRQTPRRLPYFCQHIVCKLKDFFAKDGIKLSVLYFGEDKRVKYVGGENIGRKSRKELMELYAECDFGMVASYTNISLVPYEMIAAGLPIVEFKSGSFCDFFSEDSAFLYDFDDKKLYEQIKEAMRNPQILCDRNKRNQEKLKKLSWEKTAQQFYEILNRIAE